MTEPDLIVAAHPDLVAQADQHAAARGAEVQLTRYLPPDWLLEIDRAELRRIADRVLADARELAPFGAPRRTGRLYGWGGFR